MKKLLAVLYAIVLFFAIQSTAIASTVLDFEDLSGFDYMPNPYHGIVFEDCWIHTDLDQAPYTPHSGINRISPYYIYQDPTPSWVYLEDSHFLGAWFTGTDIAYLTTSVQYDLYYKDELVHSEPALTFGSAYGVPAGDPTWYASGYNGLVDKVIINTQSEPYWTLDDLNLAPVPLPTSIWLLGSGLIGLMGFRRKYGKK